MVKYQRRRRRRRRRVLQLSHSPLNLVLYNRELCEASLRPRNRFIVFHLQRSLKELLSTARIANDHEIRLEHSGTLSPSYYSFGTA